MHSTFPLQEKDMQHGTFTEQKGSATEHVSSSVTLLGGLLLSAIVSYSSPKIAFQHLQTVLQTGFS